MFDLGDALKAAMPKRETREDVIEYYQQKYTGQKVNKKGTVTYEWHRKLAEEMQPFARGAKGQQMTIPNLMRRFQKRSGVDPLSKEPSAKQQAEYKMLGDTLPPMMPRGFVVNGTICVKFSDGPCEEREIVDLIITGEDAKKLVEEADLQMVVNLYMEEPIEGPTEGGPTGHACGGGPDCQPDLNIEPIE